MWLLEWINLFFQHRLHARSGFPGDVRKSQGQMILQVGPLVKGDSFFSIASSAIGGGCMNRFTTETWTRWDTSGWASSLYGCCRFMFPWLWHMSHTKLTWMFDLRFTNMYGIASLQSLPLTKPIQKSYARNIGGVQSRLETRNDPAKTAWRLVQVMACSIRR